MRICTECETEELRAGDIYNSERAPCKINPVQERKAHHLCEADGNNS